MKTQTLKRASLKMAYEAKRDSFFRVRLRGLERTPYDDRPLVRAVYLRAWHEGLRGGSAFEAETLPQTGDVPPEFNALPYGELWGDSWTDGAQFGQIYRQAILGGLRQELEAGGLRI
jgi:hypothetical protein